MGAGRRREGRQSMWVGRSLLVWSSVGVRTGSVMTRIMGSTLETPVRGRSGSSFSIATVRPPGDNPRSQERETTVLRAAVHAYRRCEMRILVVEDERSLASFIEQSLHAEGHAVTVCHDGPGGEAAALTGDYALVLLDLT